MTASVTDGQTDISNLIIIQVVGSLRSPTTCNCPVYFIIVISDVNHRVEVMNCVFFKNF